MGKKTLLFVYGTLKRGHQNHLLLLEQRFCGEAVTHDDFILYNLGQFPGMVDAPVFQGEAIVGEVYEVDENTLARLDILEGCPALYERREIEVSVRGNLAKVQTYVFNRDVEGYVPCGSEWRGS